MNITRHLRTFLWPAVLVLLLSACAAGRSTVEITPPSAVNPDGTAYAKIVSVEDLRKFEARPDDAGTPSLQNASDITDPSITARAVARKRGGFGMALGDIVLPPRAVSGGARSFSCAEGARRQGLHRGRR
jgi:hypothetical protein